MSVPFENEQHVRMAANIRHTHVCTVYKILLSSTTFAAGEVVVSAKVCLKCHHDRMSVFAKTNHVRVLNYTFQELVCDVARKIQIFVSFEQGLTQKLEGPVQREPHVHLRKTKNYESKARGSTMNKKHGRGIKCDRGLYILTVDAVGGAETARIELWRLPLDSLL